MIVYNEETADFRKSEHITSKDYVQARQSFIAAKPDRKVNAFLNYCLAIVYQKNLGTLSIREAAYVISDCADHYNEGTSAEVDAIIKEAYRLRRHPSNYKEDHQLGWSKFVKEISNLRKRF